jgi:hypothetical protein
VQAREQRKFDDAHMADALAEQRLERRGYCIGHWD